MSLRKTWFIVLVLGMIGCATIDTPHYIQAENPYKRTYYGSFDDVLSMVRETLKEEGWQIVKEVDPTLYERNPLYSSGDKEHILIFTQIKRAQRVVYSRTTHLNIYVNRISDGIEVDVRYGAVRNFHLWKTRSYRNNALIKQMLDHIEQKLLLNPGLFNRSGEIVVKGAH